MFIGHYAVGFAAKKFAPKASLGILIAAPIFLDLIWPIFLLLGWERVKIDPGNTAFTPLAFENYPISHSLLSSIIWATLFGGLYHAVTRYFPGTIWIWIGVVSHWFMDAIVHRPDLPLYPGSTLLVGMGLWNNPAATMMIESLLFALGTWIYVRQTRPMDKIGIYGFWGFVIFLYLIYLGNIFGPPPPNSTAIGVVALLTCLFVPWAWWFDAHRVPRNGENPRNQV